VSRSYGDPAAGAQRLEGRISMNSPGRHVRRDGGQGLAEYALILALIAIVAILALIFLGSQISQILSDVGNSV